MPKRYNAYVWTVKLKGQRPSNRSSGNGAKDLAQVMRDATRADVASDNLWYRNSDKNGRWKLMSLSNHVASYQALRSR